MFDNFNQKYYRELFSKFLTYALIGYVFFILGRSVWSNFQLKKEINNIKQQISSLEAQNKNLENLIVYYQSDSFQEVEARAKLGLKKPGETAVAVPTKKYDNFASELEAEKGNIAAKSSDQTAANWQNWWYYFTR